jgi:hypothetical protein
MSALAQLLNVPIVTLREYIQNGRVPHFDSLLHFCRTLSIRPLEFLKASSILLQRIPQSTIDQVLPLSRSAGQPLPEEDVQFIRNAIEDMLKEDTDPFPSLQELTGRLGCYFGAVQEHCPDLYQAVIARSSQRWPDDFHERVKQALLSSSPKLSKRAVRRLNVRTKSPLSRGAILHQKSKSTKGNSS